MNEINSFRKVPEDTSSKLVSNLRTELDVENKQRGTNIAGRMAIDINEVSSSETEEKTELITEVKENLEKLNEYIPLTSTNLSFEFDEFGEPPIVKVLDRESNEVIREIPSKEFREVAQALEEFADKLSKKGVFFDHSA